MKVPPPLELIRQKQTFYLGDQEPSGRYLAVQLADCAIASGAHRIELLVLPEGWMAVVADEDWITPSLRSLKLADVSLENAFNGLMPLQGGRPNQVRFEVFVTAFSTSVSVKSHEHWTAIEGSSPPPEIRDAVDRNEFAVVFKPSGAEVKDRLPDSSATPG